MAKIPQYIESALALLVGRPLLINAYVNRISRAVVPSNWGDDINDHFIRLLSGRDIEIYFSSPIAMRLRMLNYLCIGSTLNYLTTPETIVWGAGAIDGALGMRAKPLRVCAVRGPLTRQYLLDQGIHCPAVFGDPALLIPYFYKPSTPPSARTGRIGIVPHYTDLHSPVITKILQQNPNFCLIDITQYRCWTDFIDSVCACETILSSSLHGLIVAESYAIRNHWIQLSSGVIGNGYKFLDFFASIGKSTCQPHPLDESFDLAPFLLSADWRPGRIDLGKLLESCPFEVNATIRYEHPMDL